MSEFVDLLLDRFFISSNIGEHNIYTIDTYTYTFMNLYIQILTLTNI